MSAYKTEQRKLLLSFFQEHPDQQFTAREIYSLLSECGISQSAVYRNLSAMTEAEILHHSIKNGSREAVYQYLHNDECINELHLTCKKCGHNYHMNRKFADRIKSGVLQTDGFHIDLSATVLYGICKTCNQK